MTQRRVLTQSEPFSAASLYVNHFEVAHNQYEFLVEFGQYRPSKEEVEGTLAVHTCLALSPPYAKMLSELLSRAVQQHEKGHGVIAPVGEGAAPFDVVLHSLPEFEERARQLRARQRAELERGLGQPEAAVKQRRSRGTAHDPNQSIGDQT
jgi:hypothetical protein